MDKEELKKQLTIILEELGVKDIVFQEPEENRIVVVFNWKNFISFKAKLDGWTYTGIQLDPTHEREYKIEFFKEQK